MKTCSIVELGSRCSQAVKGRGWCGKHYARWQRHGDPLKVLVIMGDDVTRFWSYVDASGPCWEWTGATFREGYGMFQVDGAPVLTHRYVWELLVGPIPEGLEIDHLCRVRHCVNPDHLEPVTSAENSRRRVLARTA